VFSPRQKKENFMANFPSVIAIAIEKLQELCGAAPALNATGLRCAAAPHLTFLEYLTLFDNLQKNLTASDLQELVALPPRPIDPVHLACPLLNSGLCLARGGQGVFCHLGEDLANCIGYTPLQIEKILTDLMTLAAPLHENLVEPYYLNLLNFHCWIAVMLDQNITQPLFADLRERMASYFDTAPLTPHYQNHTKLKEKLDLIDLFFLLNAEQRAPEALSCIQKIQSDFPLTGAYYGEQADAYLKFMEEIVKVIEQRGEG
jgi:hypothetical protein